MVQLLLWPHAARAEQALCEDGIFVEPTLRKERNTVTQILIRDGESFEGAIKRFTRKVQQDGVLSEAKRRRHYEPPSVKRKRKAEARVRKVRKAMAKAAARGF
jgi:small subunit ribosomal protein S21